MKLAIKAFEKCPLCGSEEMRCRICGKIYKVKNAAPCVHVPAQYALCVPKKSEGEYCQGVCRSCCDKSMCPACWV